MTWKKYQLFLNIVATVIVAIVVIGILIISFNYLIIPDTKTQTVKIEYHISKSKNEESNRTEIKKLDSILKSITETSNKIQQKQLELIDDKSDENFFNKLYTAIVAIILAIAGFFGFKSISEIKSQAIEDAKKESSNIAKKESKKIAKKIAKKEAKEEFIRTFNPEYAANVFEQANLAMNELLRTEIQSLDERIYALEQNGDNPDDNIIENDDPDGNGSDENPTLETLNNENNNLVTDINIVEPENPFENE
jgi:hypothetical protein